MTKRSPIVKLAALSLVSLAASEAQAVCTFGGSGEPSLQGTFDTMFPDGSLSAVNACVDDGNDAAWRTVGTSAGFDVLLELAGNRDSNEFGIYDLSNPTRLLTVFEGADDPGASMNIRLRAQGNLWRVGVADAGSNSWTWLRDLSTSAFGFYLRSGDDIFYSNTALNTDSVDHMYAYQGNGAVWEPGSMYEEDQFMPTDFIFAWEDLNGGGDRDYQDFVLVGQDLTPVPLPPAAWLLISGLVGLIGVSRRQA